MSRRPGDLNNLLPPVSLFLAVFVIGIATIWWPLILIIAVVALVTRLYTWLEQDQPKKPGRDPAAERAAYRRALRLRADQQHKWALEGDPRGTYGRYTPADL